MTEAAACPGKFAKAIAMGALLALAGCQTARIDDIAPQSTAQLPPPSASAPPAAGGTAAASADTAERAEDGKGRPPPGWPPPGSARDTGTYPDLNVPPPVATTQITNSQESASKTELNALKQRAQGTAKPTVSNQAALRKLGNSRGQDILKEIEASGGQEEAAY